MCNTISLIGGSIYGLYYGIFLYKHTFSLQILALDGLLGGLGLWLGYLAGVLIIKRSGYDLSLRMAFLSWAGIAFLTALIAGHIGEWYMILAVLKGLPSGMYAAAGDTVMLRDVGSEKRNGFFKMSLAIEFATSIILPSAVGALISVTNGYEWSFIISGIIYLIGACYRYRLPKPQVSLGFRGMAKLFNRPLYPQHALNRTLSAGFNQLNGFALTIVPFLLLKDEMSIGVLTSVSAVVAIIVALASRRLKNHKQLKIGYGAYGVRAIAALMFVASWSAPMMAFWQLIGKIMTPLHDPLQQSLDIHNDSLVLGKRAQVQALQMNIVNTTLKFIGTTAAFGGFVLITQASSDAQRSILAALIVVYAAWRFINLGVSAKINKWGQNIDEYRAVRDKRLETYFSSFDSTKERVWYVRYRVRDIIKNLS